MDRKLEKIILAAVSGAATGAILGMLFAPDKGSDTRKKIGQKGDDYLKRIRKDINELRKYLDERTQASKNEINEIGQNARKKGEDVLKKVKKMGSYEEWTKEELYNQAKEADIDGYSQMNKAELIEALRNQRPI